MGVGPRELRHSEAILEIFEGFGVSRESFTPVFTPLGEMRLDTGVMDVFATFLGADLSRIRDQIRRGGKIFSLDDYRLDGKGSRVDGFVLRNPDYHSIVIPKNALGAYPQEPVLTLALTVVLVTSKHTPDTLVYDVAETVLENAHTLSRRNPLLGFLSRRMNEMHLNAPLHEGTKQYLNRDQPSFLEKYAEVIALMVTIGVLAVGAAGSANKFWKRRMKDRIDVYYQGVQDVEERVAAGALEAAEAEKELFELRRRAVVQLQQEKLVVDESFSIFLSLVHSSLSRLRPPRESGSEG